MKLKLKNKDSLKKKLDIIATEMPAEYKKALERSALLVESSAKRRIMRGPKTGRIYERGGVVHQASAPGQAPANDRGLLVSSIQHWIKDAGMRVEIGSKLAYASWLEFGTKHMAARPWLFPSLEENRKKIVSLMADAIERAVQKAKKK